MHRPAGAYSPIRGAAGGAVMGNGIWGPWWGVRGMRAGGGEGGGVVDGMEGGWQTEEV